MSTFKINAKQFLITWPKCDLSPNEVLSLLQVQYQISKYTISQEKHNDGTPHVHALLVLSSRLHTTNARCFDLGTWHPNIKNLKTKKDVIQADNYVRKDGVFITNIQEVLGKRAALAKSIVEEGRITKKFIIENPEVIFLNYSSINSWLSYFKKPFQKEPPSLKKRHYWVTGPSNSGKTYWLRTYLKFSTNFAQIPPNNDFQDVDEDTDVLYYDEYRGQLTIQALNRLCDGGTQLNKKGGSCRISYPVIIIVSNYTIRDCYPKVEDKIYDTLVNRFIEFDMSINIPPLPRSIINI